ncbi:DNA primase [Streptomyces sp.]|uniref:DNA primase n=1 Tax=Streptomyces sp. TaxID=1931 RepID=UPI0028117E16|nr:DNA primase [Streptomyces sp.]
MNRVGLGLAIGAGYLLGRTRKLKAAVAVGGLVAGKKLNLGPRGIADLVSQQLRDNPQFKELGDQLRGDLRGVGKAASGALVERQLDALADRLHGRTTEMRDRLTGAGRQEHDAGNAGTEDAGAAEEEDREPQDEQGEEEPASGRAAKKTPSKKKAPSKEAAKRPAGKTAAKKAAPAKKAAAKKTAAARSTATRGTRSRTSKGGGEG